MKPFKSSLEHLLAELNRIDLLIRFHVVQAQQTLGAGDQFQGLYISEREVTELLERQIGVQRWDKSPAKESLVEVQAMLGRMADEISKSKDESVRHGVTFRLNELARQFELTRFDIEVLLICLAPEIDLRYERLYAYLQDDVTKKRPSVDLVLNLLCSSFKKMLVARNRFNLSAPLRNYKLLSLFEDPIHHKPPLLSKYLKVDERIVNYLLEIDEIDIRIQPYAHRANPQTRLKDLFIPAELKKRLNQVVESVLIHNEEQARQSEALVFYFQGPYGVGKRSMAEALCNQLGLGLLIIDGEQLVNTDRLDFTTTVQLVFREAILQGSALLWTGFDTLLAEEKRVLREMLERELERRRGLTLLFGETTWEPVDALRDVSFLRMEFPRPDYPERLQLWKSLMNGVKSDDVDPLELANKFRFSGGQIRDSVVTARNLAYWHDPGNEQVTMNDLYTACRLQSNRKLATLAQKVDPHYSWDDIVLPPNRLGQLREIYDAVKFRAQVYDEWGFDGKFSLGKGLNVLFAGPSGTGKTMAADIIAGELQLDLYKIDLSTVVSKYIGETEKNLARLFIEAETSNAILFFDEADALFGKRSEVHDSHDRYANIEISYLLQKMEEYEGIVILATNLRKNLDDAFVRRMHFSVEFPLPTEAYRRNIWEGIWPDATPLGSDLKLEFMAKQFEVTGGNIRNIALAAAFRAAEDGGVVKMTHLLQSTRREYQKMGKVINEGIFEGHSTVG